MTVHHVTPSGALRKVDFCAITEDDVASSVRSFQEDPRHVRQLAQRALGAANPRLLAQLMMLEQAGQPPDAYMLVEMILTHALNADLERQYGNDTEEAA